MAIRKETRSIADFIADVAYRKHRAALARFAGNQTGSEAPRDVYRAACESIAAHLEQSFGFKYAKSGPHSRTQSGDFTFQISFQSSHHNIGGEHVVLWIHGNVRSARINKWRKQQASPQSFDYVAGGQIGNLQADQRWLEWELADPHNRNETIRDAITAIEELAFPYFAKFEDLPTLFHLLLEQDIPVMTIDRVIEFLMCFADQPTARRAAANFLKRRPDLVEAYQGEFEQFARTGLQSVFSSGYAKQLAFASHAFEFGDLAESGKYHAGDGATT
jgi:hypothetical protein